MANLRKLSINVVTPNKPKLLVGLNQKGSEAGLDALHSSNTDTKASGG